ncbi:MAG: hypothetical protein WD604_07480 [Balneolaceae bacterium]
MIYYSPINGDALVKLVEYSPRSCFIMTKLGKPIPPIITEIRKALSVKLNERSIKEIDASSEVTGRDFLLKIWKQILSVPPGICIIDETMNAQTMANVFYEIGVLQSYGKETLIIKTKKTKIPSDFVRTEYISFDQHFDSSLDKYFNFFFSLEEYFIQMSEQLENNPLLSIDYLKRAYLISGDEDYKKKVKELSNALDLAARAKNSVENLITRF